MGIITNCVKCNSCGDQYRLRYNLGNKYPQSATFHCQVCGEALTFGYGEEEQILENMSIIPFSMNLKIVNLHPELTLEADATNDPLYFPSINFMVRQSEKGKDGMAMFQDAQQCCILYQQQWDEVQKEFRYLKEQRWQMLVPIHGKEKQQAEHKIIMKVFDAADYFLQGRWSVMADQVLDVIGTAFKHPGYKKLHDYLLGYKEDFLFNKLYAVMVKYREAEAALLPTLLHQKCGFQPEGFTSTVTWEKIEMIYGDFFEVYGDLLIIPTTLNNLLSRNDFEKFNSENFNLNKYLDADKSGKTENFKASANLCPLSEFYDSGIRNGTHHQASTFDKERQLISFKTGKGGRQIKTMTLVSYIEHCNEIYARILAVLKAYYLINMMHPKDH
ncbi:MAG: hypothetical protein EOO45_01150 [Flavobacterium sp.]|nr:MAG: hypothetical protein EOO45_01150 [Flavobacterium sp.]